MTEPPPGLAVERTVLAWTRTWLAVGACALLLFRISIGSTALVGAALATGATSVAITTFAGRRRASHLRAIAPRPDSLSVPTTATSVTAGTVVLLGLAAAAFVVAR